MIFTKEKLAECIESITGLVQIPLNDFEKKNKRLAKYALQVHKAYLYAYDDFILKTMKPNVNQYICPDGHRKFWWGKPERLPCGMDYCDCVAELATDPWELTNWRQVENKDYFLSQFVSDDHEKLEDMVRSAKTNLNHFYNKYMNSYRERQPKSTKFPDAGKLIPSAMFMSSQNYEDLLSLAED